MATPWPTLAAALPYGYGLYWLVRVEGIPSLFMELVGDAVAPTGYVLDGSLVIDRAARLGCLIEGESHIAKGFDLELRLMATDIVDSVFRAPSRLTVLTSDLTAAATSASVASTVDWPGGEIYIGTSCLPFSGVEAAAFTGLDRATYGRARRYKAGTVVASNPTYWLGRRVDLFAVLLDPSGRYVQGADILSSAAMMWSGYVSTRPVRDGTDWVMSAQDQVRRIADPIGVAASGKALWLPHDDVEVNVPQTAQVQMYLELLATGAVFEATVSPWTGLGTRAYLSQLRQAVADALTAAITDAHVLGFRWAQRAEAWNPAAPLDANLYELMVNLNPDPGDERLIAISSVLGAPSGLFFGLGGSMGDYQWMNDASAAEERSTYLFTTSRVNGFGLSVLLDKGDASSVPTTGIVLLEGGGRVDYVRYTNASLDPGDDGRVNLTLDSTTRIAGEDVLSILEGDRADVSIRFLWSDSGPAADILRRALTSTGDAIHGVWDTLPYGQGLGLPMVDLDSFERVFAGLYRDLTFQIAVDSGTTVAKTFGDLLLLSRRALMTRRSADGSEVQIAACDVGPLDGAVPVATIDASKLVSIRGRRPIRVKDTFAVPQAIEVTGHTVPAGETPASESMVRFKGLHLTDWTRKAWELEVYGLDRASLLGAGRAWALSWFRGGETRQIIEVDIPPWVDAQAGDVVELDLPDPTLWDYATGTAGYSGLGRVLGSQLDLTTAIVTLRIAIDGMLGAGPMCPSLEILAVNGSASAPTSIDVDEAHYDLLVHAKRSAADLRVLAYLPGFDYPGGEYTASTVTKPGGGVARLTVTAYPTAPSVTLTTSYRLTWPTTARSTNEQRLYLHTDQRVQWG